MQAVLEIEGIPKTNVRPWIVARLWYGRLFYYNSYLTEKEAYIKMCKLEYAMIVKGE